MKIAVYTCITNAYDNLPSILSPEEGVDYICFTDNEKYYKEQDKTNSWKFKSIIFTGSGAQCNRAIKLLPHVFLNKNYTHSVYIDGNIDVVGSISELVEIYGNSSFAVYEHPFRNNLKDEFIVCALSGHATLNRIKHEFKKAMRWGYFEDNQFYECSVLLRQHNKANIIKQSLIWWNLYCNGIKRDQLYFKISMQLSDVSITNMGISDPRYVKKFFTHRILHNSKIRLKQRIISWVNRCVVRVFPQMLELNQDSVERVVTNSGVIHLICTDDDIEFNNRK